MRLKTSLKAKSKGFTFLELIAVTAFLALLVAVVAPRLVPAKDSSDLRRFFSLSRALFTTAREDAISLGVPITVRIENETTLIATRANQDDSQRQDTIHSVAMPAGVTIGKAVSAGQEENTADWEVTFQPDGTCLGGGLQFDLDDEAYRSVTVRETDGAILYTTGEIQAQTEEKWTAGEHEKRF